MVRDTETSLEDSSKQRVPRYLGQSCTWSKCLRESLLAGSQKNLRPGTKRTPSLQHVWLRFSPVLFSCLSNRFLRKSKFESGDHQDFETKQHLVFFLWLHQFKKELTLNIFLRVWSWSSSGCRDSGSRQSFLSSPVKIPFRSSGVPKSKEQPLWNRDFWFRVVSYGRRKTVVFSICT